MELSPWTREPIEALLRTLIGCFAGPFYFASPTVSIKLWCWIETIAFHTGIILACHIVLNLVGWARSWNGAVSPSPISGIRQEFRFVNILHIHNRPSSTTLYFVLARLSLIPLTLFYSSLTKLFLLFLLAIWRPVSAPIPTTQSDSQSTQWTGTIFNHLYISSAFEILDDDKIDREWVVRNVLGGMAAGFGLRGSYLPLTQYQLNIDQHQWSLIRIPSLQQSSSLLDGPPRPPWPA